MPEDTNSIVVGVVLVMTLFLFLVVLLVLVLLIFLHRDRIMAKMAKRNRRYSLCPMPHEFYTLPLFPA